MVTKVSATRFSNRCPLTTRQCTTPLRSEAVDTGLFVITRDACGLYHRASRCNYTGTSPARDECLRDLGFRQS